MWQPYADFEREKLRALGGWMMVKGGGYQLVFLKNGKRKDITSYLVTGYSYQAYRDDSESSRLLKRAEFIKAVCEKEGVEWLPAKKPCLYGGEPGYELHGETVCAGNFNRQPITYETATRLSCTCEMVSEKMYRTDKHCPEHGTLANFYTKAEIDEMLKSLPFKPR